MGTIAVFMFAGQFHGSRIEDVVDENLFVPLVPSEFSTLKSIHSMHNTQSMKYEAQ